MRAKWDIFCRIIDNFGDIGVCWRLAKQLANEYPLEVRLFIDDMRTAQHIIPTLNLELDYQTIDKVRLCKWREDFKKSDCAELVIEAFACDVPNQYLKVMAAQNPKPKWINLEYLTAESWAAESHLLPSPHPSLPLIKYFFFPGFSAKSGGLIREKHVTENRITFQKSAQMQQAFWSKLGVNSDAQGIKISLFCYPHAPIHSLLTNLASANTPTLCLVPTGSTLPKIAQFFGKNVLNIGDIATKGQLTLQVIPFLSHAEYDQLLQACDLNFVRGEDSWVRAIWAAKPFIWQPYQQDASTTELKLKAFLNSHYNQLDVLLHHSINEIHRAWLNQGFTCSQVQTLLGHLSQLRTHAQSMCEHFAAQHDLASNLVTHCKNTTSA